MGSGRHVPKRLSQKKAQKLLESDGWTEVQGGKHSVKMTKPGERPITLPKHKGADWGPGLTSRILAEAGLKKPESDDDEGQTGTEGKQ